MANGKILFGKPSGGVQTLQMTDSATNDTLVFPLSGTVATIEELTNAITINVNTAGITLKTIATGTATFNATTNNINLTGIGLGIEIGDVLIISGSINNNLDFTVEVITDENNIIVNQAHAGKSRTVAPIGTKALINETADVTIKLLAKYYNASDGLGQGVVDVTAQRTNLIVYPNNTNRRINVNIITTTTSTSNGLEFLVNGGRYSASDFTTSSTSITLNAPIDADDNYKIDIIGTNISRWTERR